MDDLKNRLASAVDGAVSSDALATTLQRAHRRERSRRYLALTALAIAVLALGGAALAGVFRSPDVTPISERYVVASGETDEGTWELVAYRAAISNRSRSTMGWCLDLDGAPADGSSTTRANICTLDGSDRPPEAIGAHALFPRFSGAKSLLYGNVSPDVAAVEIRFEDGGSEHATVVAGPSGAGVNYFVAFIKFERGEIVARGEAGQVLAVEPLRH